MRDSNMHQAKFSSILCNYAFRVPDPSYRQVYIGVSKLCWNNFENNRYTQTLKNYNASIKFLGILYVSYLIVIGKSS